MSNQIKKFPTAYGQLAYRDSGSGPTVVAVHGTPTHSGIWERVTSELGMDVRMLRPDLIGFGQSDKPTGWPGTPADHSGILRDWLRSLGQTRLDLIVHDFGGPIGLGAVLDEPFHVRRLVIFNSWCWSTEGTPAVSAGKMAATPIGRWLYLRMAFSSRVLLPMLFKNRKALTPEVRQEFQAPFKESQSRWATWQLAKSLHLSNNRLAELEQKLVALADVPTLIIWGERDPAFSGAHLSKWQAILPHAKIEKLALSGHFPMLEEPETAARLVREFLLARSGHDGP